ncbi:hypothetical protein [Clostridium sp. CF012]|nr:hypothetical protein [Clostridium sp. CF012]MBU3142166.1 hypothetical protein [Clostridium sp. CF012]
MKVNSTIIELNKSETELLNELYTRAALKILAPELSLNEINELIEKLSEK